MDPYCSYIQSGTAYIICRCFLMGHLTKHKKVREDCDHSENTFSPLSGFTNIQSCLENTKGWMNWKDDAVKCFVSTAFLTHNKVTKPHISIFKYGGLKATLCTFLRENFRFSLQRQFFERDFLCYFCARGQILHSKLQPRQQLTTQAALSSSLSSLEVEENRVLSQTSRGQFNVRLWHGRP